MPAIDLVVGGEVAAEHRLHAQHREELPGDSIPARIGRLAAFALQPKLRARDVRKAVERVLHPPPVQVHLRRRRSAAERRRFRRVVLEHDREAVVLVERKGAQDDGVHDGEDGRPGTDPKRQHRQGDSGERW